jgi:hypothetical protein
VLAAFTPLKKHLQKPLVKIGEIGVALTTEKLDFTQDLGLIAILGKAAIGVLQIAGGYDHTIGNFEKIGIIAALRASNPH